MAQHARAHHRRQRQRYERGDQNGDAQRHSKFAEETPDDIAHEEQRDEHGNERDRQRQDGEADLFGAFQRSLQRRFALLDVAHDVLDHDDGVIDHEAGGDGQRHERQVVQAIPQHIHGAERANQ